MKTTKIKAEVDTGLDMNTYYASGGACNQQQKIEIDKWIVSLTAQMKNPWSVILTHKERIAGGAPTEREIARAEGRLKKNFTKLCEGLSRNGLGDSFWKHKKRIKVVGLFEYSYSNERYHIHAIFDVPKCKDPKKTYDAKFRNDVIRMWHWHGQVIEAEEVAADIQAGISKEESLVRLCHYISKLRTKKTESGSFADALLIEGYNNR